MKKPKIEYNRTGRYSKKRLYKKDMEMNFVELNKWLAEHQDDEDHIFNHRPENLAFLGL